MNFDKYNQSSFLVIKAAYLYYIKEKPQNVIAEELNISITTVSRLLKRAKEERIVQFVIRDNYIECIELEAELKEAFQLQNVIIAPSSFYPEEDGENEDPESDKKLVALEAARYLQRIIRPGDTLGITWGSTVYEMINYLNPAQRVDATFVTLHGSLAACKDEWDVRTLVQRLAKAFSGKKYAFLSDALMSSSETVVALKKEKRFAQMYKIFDKVDISICGIGSFYLEVTTILASPSYIEEKLRKQLEDKEVVGDIALRFFDKNGKECETDLKERTISIDFETYKKIPQKIAIASGRYKAHTVYYALIAGLIDVLIVDSKLGTELIRLYQKNKEKKDR